MKKIKKRTSGYQDWTCHKCGAINTTRKSTFNIFLQGRCHLRCNTCEKVFQLMEYEFKRPESLHEWINLIWFKVWRGCEEALDKLRGAW